jgi:hypothetical protein
MDINKIPKQFCESVNGGFAPDFFVVIMSSGESVTAYSFTPQHMKRTALWINHQLEEYEKKYGTISLKRSLGIQSPIQISDLKKPDNK